ncbi:MAG: heavy metal-associated domain-containing protein [Minicystis sp.]
MSQKNETLLDVTGMTCRSCVRHVDHALRELEGVSSVEVRLSEGKVMVRHDPGAAPVASLIEALREAGYPSSTTAA